MISIEDSIPTVSNTYLLGQDIFFTQFNDVNFYVEDLDQENFYLLILKKLFHDVQIEKIFPLNGKRNVIDAARSSNNDKKKIFIVDKDFDDFLNTKENIENLFYLEKYSIENYLMDIESIREYIIEEKPSLKKPEIDFKFDWNLFTDECVALFYELTSLHLLVQKKCSHIPNTSLNPEKFCIFTNSTINSLQLNNYKHQIETELRTKDKRLKFPVQLSKSMKQIGSQKNEILNNIPGKYLTKLLRYKIEHLFNLSKRNAESFNYRIAKNSTFISLNFLEISIRNFLIS